MCQIILFLQCSSNIMATLSPYMAPTPLYLPPATFHQLTRMLHTNAIATCHSVTMLPQQTNLIPTNPTTFTKEIPELSQLPSDLASILKQYLQFFSTPTSLPPNRIHDHHIHLSPNSTPIKIKPYCYPHYQIEAMAKIIAEMLEVGFIRPNTSPFSSPVLLVKKKDGSWRFL